MPPGGSVAPICEATGPAAACSPGRRQAKRAAAVTSTGRRLSQVVGKKWQRIGVILGADLSRSKTSKARAADEYGVDDSCRRNAA